ncbi:MAG TPA: nuclear transport factor 2 family protein [Chitinophagaceae bacterium]|nr:nuclear transport factor 2 family protein [Chitinophagaceae bacterium]
MKKLQLLLLILFLAKQGFSQSGESEKIQRACLDYIEGFYEGDTTKLIRSLKPTLYKIGYWKNKEGKYDFDGQMTYRQAIDYAKRVAEKKNFAKPGAPKQVELLNIGNTIAAAKVTAWWGIDYILLAKQDDVWKIEQVLWEGPLGK